MSTNDWQGNSRHLAVKRALTARGMVLGALILCLGASLQAQINVTPARYLASQPKPNFAPGHHLPRLTQWGQILSTNDSVELAQHWGYALPIDVSDNTIARIMATNSDEYFFMTLASNSPSQYSISVIMNRAFPPVIPTNFYCTNASGLLVNDASNSWASLTNTSYSPVISPQGPDSYWAAAAAYDISSLQTINSNCQISIILNGGEYGLGVVGSGDTNAWNLDPQVQTAITNVSVPAGVNIWTRYASNQKAHQLGFYTTLVRQLFTNRSLYIYYKTDAERARTIYTTNGVWEGPFWGWDSDVMNANTDLPSFEAYYEGSTGSQWTGNYDLLTCYLNGVGFNINLGYKTNYSWVSGGWQHSTNYNTNLFSDIPTYTGFLKCMYTAGMVGAVAGYFYEPTVGFDVPFPTNNPPQWLLQMMALAQVHALFSQLENFLDDGDLLAGNTAHRYSLDQPAYEFTNSAADTTARVLVRKIRNDNRWLVTAWAAAGPDRNVSVTIPALGTIQVLARASGSVYDATTTATATNIALIDVNGMLPTATFATSLLPPSNLRVISGGTN